MVTVVVFMTQCLGKQHIQDCLAFFLFHSLDVVGELWVDEKDIFAGIGMNPDNQMADRLKFFLSKVLIFSPVRRVREKIIKRA